ncbi:MAG: diacylglycerol kinase [Gaiellaceae bacterium]|jgi:diacylglycerol kinase (ATP)|nr:diacylglycerol kinase [Gaiellaceae bacterium]
MAQVTQTPPPPPAPPSKERRPAPASSVVASLNYAFEGVIYALRTQRNMRVHFVASAVALIAGLAVGVSRGELLALLIAASLVIVAELFNTAIEAAIDVATTSFDPRAKVAKDVAAGAVLVCAFVALAVAYTVFADRLSSPTATMLARVRESPVHLTVIAWVLVVLIVIAVKAATGRGTPVRGGLPSGHAAIAFAGWAAVLFITADSRHNVLVASITLVMAMLVAQTRVEAGIHTVVEVIYGGVLGVLVSLAIFQVWA